MKKVKNMRPVLQRIGVYLQSQYIAAFQEQGRGKKWPARKVPNLAGIAMDLSNGGSIKDRRYQGAPTLVDTGRLKNSGGTKIVGDRILWGTNVPYGGDHQWGGESVVESSIPKNLGRANVKKGLKELTKKGFEKLATFLMVTESFTIKVPARPYLEILQDDEDAIVESLEQEFLE